MVSSWCDPAGAGARLPWRVRAANRGRIADARRAQPHRTLPRRDGPAGRLVRAQGGGLPPILTGPCCASLLEACGQAMARAACGQAMARALGLYPTVLPRGRNGQCLFSIRGRRLLRAWVAAIRQGLRHGILMVHARGFAAGHPGSPDPRLYSSSSTVSIAEGCCHRALASV